MPIRSPIFDPIGSPVFGPAASVGGGVTTPLLLDLVTGAFAAYDLRKLRNAYSGSCIRIRRDSDNTEQDIGFVGNALDTAAISSFCGAGSGYVTKWYDQTTNARDLVQATTTIQPIIFESGVLCQLNSKPCLKFVAATAHRMTNGSAGDWNFLHNGTVCSCSFVSQSNDTASNKVIFATHSSGAAIGANARRTASEALQVAVGNGAGSPVNGTTSTTGVLTQRVNTLKLDPSNATAANRLSIWANGSTSAFSDIGSGSVSTSNSSALTLGAFVGGSNPWDGTVQSLLFWASDQSSNRSTIETNINTYYSVY